MTAPQPPLSASELESLAVLLKKATGLPWTAYTSYIYGEGGKHICPKPASNDDAKLICAAVNSLPGLLDQVRELQKPWVITTANGLQYLTMGDLGMFKWTHQQAEALQFCRRSDAEKVAAESEEAWRIVQINREI